MSDQKSTPDTYRANREPLWAFWLGGKKALAKFALPKDSGAALLCQYAGHGDPTALGMLVRQCCGYPPRELTLHGGEGIAPGLVFGVLSPDGSPFAVPPIPGLARPAAGVLPVPAASPGGPTA